MNQLSSLLIAAFAALSAPSQVLAAEPWPQACKLQLEASLPFTLEDRHVRIAVQLNGVPRQFIVDTGGVMSSVSDKVAAEQKLKSFRVRDDLDIGGLGGKRTKRYAVADTLTFGKLKAPDVRLLIEPGVGSGADGLIAPDYLRNFDVEFDFA